MCIRDRYIAFRRLRNFATVVIQKKMLRLFLHLDPASVDLAEGWARDVTDIGHWGTGNVELYIKDLADLRKAEPLILRAYETQ